MFQLPLPFSTEWVLLKAVEHIKKAQKGTKLVIFIEGRRIEFQKGQDKRVTLLSEKFEVGNRRILYENNHRIFEQEFMSALAKPIEKHLHAYVRSKTRNERWMQVYNCFHPDCRHYIKAEKLVNKRIRCVKCGDECITIKAQLQRSVGSLTCKACSHLPVAKALVAGREAMSEILAALELDANAEKTLGERSSLLNLPME